MTKDNNAYEDVQEMEALYTTGIWECKLIQPQWRNSTKVLRNKTEVEYDPAILFLNISKLTIKIITSNYLYIGQEWKDNGTEKDRKMVLRW